MGRNHNRAGIWVMALATVFAVGATHSAYAWEHAGDARVQVGGQIFSFQQNPMNPTAFPPPQGAKISISITGRCQDGSAMCSASSRKALGEYEYFDHFTGVKSHGKVTALQFTDTSAFCPDLAGRPTAIVDGQGNDGSTFHAEVVDADDMQPKEPDTVCYFNVSGTTKAAGPFAAPLNEQDTDEPMQHGNIEVRYGTNH